MASRVLRLRRTDKSGEHILLHISQTGSKSLDLKLIGTEHEHLYHAAFKESNVKSLQANNFSGDLEEWKSILKYALLREKPDGPLPEPLQGVEIVAAVSGATLTVTLRKNIGGITQRLGTVKLDQDDEKEEVSAFEWVDAAVSVADDLRSQLESLQASVSRQQDQVAKLNKQLDDLVKAKREHEDELLKKFAALLNAKKLKIRDQQRLLSGAQVDVETAEGVSEARSRSGKRRKAASARSGKRKAKQVDEAEDVMEDYDEQEADEVEADEEARQEDTPSATEGEDEGDLFPSGANGNGDARMDLDEPNESPPRRELPFERKDAVPAKQQSEPVVDEDEDETDDEL